MALSEGDVIAGKYELSKPIGEGGMGIVFAARHKQLGTQVAIKILREEVLVDTEAVARFDREARAAASLDSPNVLRILDVGRLESGVPYMVSELLEGTDLGVELERRQRLPLAEASYYVTQTAEAMAGAHARGVIHRDLKPTNLFLVRSSGRSLIKILDFGISKVIDDQNPKMTQTQSAFGTPLYMSPEQVRSTKTVDHRTDIWSLGVIFYELVTGTMPFRGESLTAVAVSISVDPLEPPSHRNPELPPELDEVLARALAKSPEDRFASMMAFTDALRPFAESFARDQPRVSMIGNGPRSAASVLPAPAFASDTVEVEEKRSTPWRWVVGGAIASFTLLTAVGYAVFLQKPPASGAVAAEPGASSEPSAAPSAEVVESAPRAMPTGDPVVTPTDTPTPSASATAIPQAPRASAAVVPPPSTAQGAAVPRPSETAAPLRPPTATPPATPSGIPDYL